MPNTKDIPLIDVRIIAPAERHPRIFGALTMLAPGAKMHVVSDHDPRPLHYQIEARYPGQFHWQYLAQGPDVWRVEIRRYENTGCDCTCGG
ncbi:DUF2249 domain-containing protein [Mesorhizobium sp. RMAD-H1]|uniref:DUF2249 domain-containing protein n=1 Tax=Mesorhizobium sp. RMAD-H1 TaxID=2587065 RepID=UPI00161143C5|nr:DUF2249 domain-containing protein [Mesorhizobium sp. RMAD-H1]MBB2973692.1 uncharacterized protein (DUF2249 family) [Mesorhizobium sp. RMAD-H1]